MSVLDVFDATRLCQPVVDPNAWVMGAPAPSRSVRSLPQRSEFSWWSMMRNPQALLLTGVIAAGVVQDAMLRIVSPRLA